MKTNEPVSVEPVSVGSETVPAAKASAWTEAEQQVIALYVEKKNMTRGNAVRKMRAQIALGRTAEQILAGEGTPAVVETPEMAAQTQSNLDKVNSKLTGKPQPKTGKAKAAKKGKAERKEREHKYSDEKILAAYKKNHSVQDAMKAVGCSYAWARWRCQFHGVFKATRKAAK